jgi:hypothetical protein
VRQESVRRWHKPIDVTATKPYGITVIDELKEIAPGFWFPMRLTGTVYDCDELYRNGRHLVSGSVELVVDTVDADPHYDVSFFRSIEFPPDTLVYTVRDGKIIDSETVPFPTPQGLSRFIWVFIPLVVVFGAIIILFWRRKSQATAGR